MLIMSTVKLCEEVDDELIDGHKSWAFANGLVNQLN